MFRLLRNANTFWSLKIVFHNVKILGNVKILFGMLRLFFGSFWEGQDFVRNVKIVFGVVKIFRNVMCFVGMLRRRTDLLDFKTSK